MLISWSIVLYGPDNGNLSYAWTGIWHVIVMHSFANATTIAATYLEFVLDTDFIMYSQRFSFSQGYSL